MKREKGRERYIYTYRCTRVTPIRIRPKRESPSLPASMLPGGVRKIIRAIEFRRTSSNERPLGAMRQRSHGMLIACNYAIASPERGKGKRTRRWKNDGARCERGDLPARVILSDPSPFQARINVDEKRCTVHLPPLISLQLACRNVTLIDLAEITYERSAEARHTCNLIIIAKRFNYV